MARRSLRCNPGEYGLAWAGTAARKEVANAWVSGLLGCARGSSPGDDAGLRRRGAADEGKYPDWKGAWGRFVVRGLGGQPSFDQTKPWGAGQQAPLTPEYHKILEASLADQANGGQGNFAAHAVCSPAGMPFMMVATRPLEFIVTPDTTYILVGGSDHYRRIFTDGRDWPKDIEPAYSGYSIGRWTGQDGDGRYDTLEVETRGFKGPRSYDATGLPLHVDNQSVFMERFHRDKADPNILHDEITVIDHALTRPWSVDKKYVRSEKSRLEWGEAYCINEEDGADLRRQGILLQERGRPADAHQEGPAAAGPDLLQATAEVTVAAAATIHSRLR